LNIVLTQEGGSRIGVRRKASKVKQGRSDEIVCLVWDDGSNIFYVSNCDNFKLVSTWEFLAEGAKLNSYGDINS